MGEKEPSLSQGGLEQPIKGLKDRLLRIWPLNIPERKRKELMLKQECVDEIFASAREAGIEIIDTIQTNRPDSKENPYLILAIKELEELKKQGAQYRLEFSVVDWRQPIPTEYKRNFNNKHYREFVKVAYWRRNKENVRESYDEEGLVDPQPIGEVRNPNYQLHQLQMQENLRKFDEFREALPQELPELYSSYQQELAEAEQKHKEREVQLDQQHKDWEQISPETWMQLAQSIPKEEKCFECRGTGAGHYMESSCDDCGGRGFLERPSWQDLRSRQEPYINRHFSKPSPLSSFLEFVEARGSSSYKGKIAQRRTQVGQLHRETPFSTQRVYARFIVEE